MKTRNKFFNPTTGKAAIAGPLPKCPHKDKISVVQFQFFDNGPNPGRGKSQHTMKIEVYCEARFNIHRPYWKRTAALLSPDQVRIWAEKQFNAGKITLEDLDFYQVAYMACEDFMEFEDAHWVKIGFIEDRRSKIRYPGQIVIVSRLKSGPMEAVLYTDGGSVGTDTFIYDKHSSPGSGRRLFFGF